MFECFYFTLHLYENENKQKLFFWKFFYDFFYGYDIY